MFPDAPIFDLIPDLLPESGYPFSIDHYHTWCYPLGGPSLSLILLSYFWSSTAWWINSFLRLLLVCTKVVALRYFYIDRLSHLLYAGSDFVNIGFCKLWISDVFHASEFQQPKGRTTRIWIFAVVCLSVWACCSFSLNIIIVDFTYLASIGPHPCAF